ncbi:MAG: diguanylate cyclase, partial [Phycisphaeraceae bacterium]
RPSPPLYVILNWSRDNALEPPGQSAAAAHAGAPDIAFYLPYLTLVAGLALSALLTAITWSLSSTRTRAVALAATMIQSLRQSEEQFRLSLDHAPIGVALVAPGGGFLRVNRALCELLGYTQEELLATNVQTITHLGDLESDQAQARAMLQGKISRYQIEKRYVHRDGQSIPALLSVSLLRQADGTPRYFICQVLDFRQHQLVQEMLRAAAETDSLTGLRNRASIHRRITTALGRLHADPDRSFAVLFVDFDRFKAVNDTLGHEAGDEVLVEVGQRLRSTLRQDDLVCSLTDTDNVAARLGGDEFIILLERVSQVPAVLTIVERLQARLAEPFAIQGKSLVISASIGVAMAGPEHARAEQILRDADVAMYHAKSSGPGCYRIYDPAMRACGAA